VSGEMKVGVFWRFEIPKAEGRFLPGLIKSFLPSSILRKDGSK
jgi:hypothetical protein